MEPCPPTSTAEQVRSLHEVGSPWPETMETDHDRKKFGESSYLNLPSVAPFRQQARRCICGWSKDVKEHLF